MTSDDRIDRLEQRVAVLESLVRRLAAAAPGARATDLPRTDLPATDLPATDLPPPPRPGRPVPVPPAPSVTGGPEPPPRRPGLTSEQWIGQRVFLAIGVTALLVAAGYLLKLSFERNWITPAMRCVGGLVAGGVTGAIGWRLHQRYRTYGAALVGAGAGIIYLSVWAASRLYGVLPSSAGIVGLALVSVALAMIAYAIDVEALGATAALGAFFAPVLLGSNRSNADLLLLYLASMAAGLGLVAAERRWRVAMLVVAASYFGVGTIGAADQAAPWAVLIYGVIGGTMGLHVGLREGWWETRLLTFAGGWTLIHAASERLDAPWPVLVAGLILSAPVWWFALRRPQLLPLSLFPPVESERATGSASGWSVGEALYFFTTPLLLGWAVHQLAPERFDQATGLVALIVGLPYLLAGYLRPRPVFALVGAAAMALAATQHWNGSREVWALLGLALIWPALDSRLGRSDGRWYGLLTLLLALQVLFNGALAQRTAADAAFTGPWALSLWGSIAATAGFAAGLWRVDADREDTRLIRAGLWAAAGTMTLFGVTEEIRRHFELRSLSAESASLASGLAVSAWWLVFAAALVVLGFQRSLKPVRVAGLAVAGLAVAKVVLFDLSTLDALYRVGSVFLLALVALSLAYLYYRYDRTERTL
jgi:uncharacterized membrane protein